MQFKGCDLIRITETWWYSAHSWSAATDGYRLFRKDSDGEELPFEARAAGMHELCLRTDKEPAESQVMSSRQTSMVTVVVAVCYRPPLQIKRWSLQTNSPENPWIIVLQKLVNILASFLSFNIHLWKETLTLI